MNAGVAPGLATLKGRCRGVSERTASVRVGCSTAIAADETRATKLADTSASRMNRMACSMRGRQREAGIAEEKTNGCRRERFENEKIDENKQPIESAQHVLL